MQILEVSPPTLQLLKPGGMSKRYALQYKLAFSYRSKRSVRMQASVLHVCMRCSRLWDGGLTLNSLIHMPTTHQRLLTTKKKKQKKKKQRKFSFEQPVLDA